MRLCEKAELCVLAPLYAGEQDTLIESCLSGLMGRAYVPEDARDSALLVLGDFAFPGGRADEALLADFSRALGENECLMTARDQAWNALIEKTFAGRLKRGTRYAFERRAAFDRARLTAYAQRLPAGYSLHLIDDALYDEALKYDWSRDFAAQFESAADYALRGLGVAALYEGAPVAGASAYAVWPGGIEIELDTEKAHQRKGLARACAARLILEALSRGLTPTWDAANPVSVHIAAQLGYIERGPYAIYELNG